MRVTQVESSMIYAVRYDPERCELEVFFHSGRVYGYLGVEKKVYEELLDAESKGRFMRDEIIGVYDDYEVTSRRSIRR